MVAHPTSSGDKVVILRSAAKCEQRSVASCGVHVVVFVTRQFELFAKTKCSSCLRYLILQDIAEHNSS